jgi:Domain of unknown function (DUF6457)
MDEWLDRWAEALGEHALGSEEIGAMLRLSRDVAHGVERKLAPLSSYLAGIHVGRRLSEGANLSVALGEVRAAATRLVPEPAED